MSLITTLERLNVTYKFKDQRRLLWDHGKTNVFSLFLRIFEALMRMKRNKFRAILRKYSAKSKILRKI